MIFLTTTFMVFWRVLYALVYSGSDTFNPVWIYISLGVSIPLGIVAEITKVQVLPFPLFRLLFFRNIVSFYGMKYTLIELISSLWNGTTPYRTSKATAPERAELYKTQGQVRPNYTSRGGNAPAGTYTPAPPKKKYTGSASSNGRTTGFEPRALQGYSLNPKPRGMRGSPGSGLDGAKAIFGEQRVAAGAKGEMNFALSLKKTRMLPVVDSWWSVHIPRAGSSYGKEGDVDVDCIIRIGSSVFLIDVKNYVQGDVKYTSRGNELICKDKNTGETLREYSFTQNMKMATERYQSASGGSRTGLTFKPRVLLMPTDKGMGQIDRGTKVWNIPVVSIQDILQELDGEIRREQGNPTKRTTYISGFDHIADNMVK